MQKKSKSYNILQTLQKRLSVLKKGDRFATECELCKEFKVSRTTINRIIKELEYQGFLQRVQGSGTFVNHPDGEKCVKFLLPCPEYMVYDCTYPLRLILYGAQKEIERQGRFLEGVWVSAVNDKDNIDWTQLEDFGEDTKVIVPGFWFSTVFDFLNDRGCDVVLVDTQSQSIDCPSAWSVISVDILAGLQSGAEYLCSLSRDSVAFIHEYTSFSDPRKTMVEDCFKKSNKWADLSFLCETPGGLDRAMGKLMKLKKENIFDAIFLSSGEFASSVLRQVLSAGLSIPDDIAILANGDSEWLVSQTVPVSAVGVPYIKMGREAALHICDRNTGPVKKIFSLSITIRESTKKNSGASVNIDCFPELPEKKFFKVLFKNKW